MNTQFKELVNHHFFFPTALSFPTFQRQLFHFFLTVSLDTYLHVPKSYASSASSDFFTFIIIS